MNEYLRNSSLRENLTVYSMEKMVYAINQNVPSTSLSVAGIPDRGILRRRFVPPVLESGTLTSNMVNVTHRLYSAKSKVGPVINPGKKNT